MGFDPTLFHFLGVLNIYEELTGIDSNALLKENYNDLDLLTGIELHTCNKWWGGTTYGITNSIRTGKSNNCTTPDLMNYQIMHRGEWMTYDGYILGECSHLNLNSLV